MEIVKTVPDWQRWRSAPAMGGRTLGFVPTMGALHAGHVALLERARRENDVVVLSIFVNPTQFNDPSDLDKYPRPWEPDLAAAQKAGVDSIFAPQPGEIYADDYRFRVTENRLSAIFEGVHRPGHFDGVLTVVLKLLLLIRADRAYFGEKDLQQLLLVRDMAATFFIPTEIVGCPTVRARDGLALSSRNTRLSPEARARAPEFARILREEENPEAARAKLASAGFEVDYIGNYDRWRLGAVRLEGIRLIDNVSVANPF